MRIRLIFLFRAAVAAKEKAIKAIDTIIAQLESKGIAPTAPEGESRKQEVAGIDEDLRVKTLEADLTASRKRYHLEKEGKENSDQPEWICLS